MAINSKREQTEEQKKQLLEKAKQRAKDVLRSRKQKNDQHRTPPPEGPSDEVRL